MRLWFHNQSHEGKGDKEGESPPLPLHMPEAAELEIVKLLEAVIIRRVEKQTDWCSPGMFVVKPSGALRLVTDFRRLNEYLTRPHHHFLTTETFAKMVILTLGIFVNWTWWQITTRCH